jgi:hypothetical protein
MRNSVGLFGLACGLIVISLVARYGYKTTEDELDAYIAAFIYGSVTAGGLFLHGVAARLRRNCPGLSMASGLVGIGALALSLSNSLGAIAIRSESETIKKIDHNRQIEAAETELARLTKLHNAMPDFIFTDAIAVQAAQQASSAAAANKAAGCKKRGPKCQQREVEAQAAANRLTETTAAKAATDRARELEASAKAERQKLDGLGARQTVNQQGTALARLFRLPEAEADFAATAQQCGMAAIVELIIIICMMAWEALGQEKRTTENVQRVEVLTPVLEPVAIPAVTVDAPRKLPSPVRPKLAVSNRRTVGPVLDFLHDGVEVTAGPRTENGRGIHRLRGLV